MSIHFSHQQQQQPPSLILLPVWEEINFAPADPSWTFPQSNHPRYFLYNEKSPGSFNLAELVGQLFASSELIAKFNCAIFVKLCHFNPEIQ